MKQFVDAVVYALKSYFRLDVFTYLLAALVFAMAVGTGIVILAGGAF